MTNKPNTITQSIIDEWRELGFYYQTDENPAVNQWQFFGSKKGLQNFVRLLEEYPKNPDNEGLSEHQHYGPYKYLKIMTWDKPIITASYIAGTLQDLNHLKDLIAGKLKNTNAGQTFDIDKEYGQDNTITAKFFIMEDDFDPVSLDKNCTEL